MIPTIASLPAAICSPISPAATIWRAGTLPLLSWEASITTRSGSASARSLASASSTPASS